MTCLKTSFTENDVADLTGKLTLPSCQHSGFVLPWVLCWFLRLMHKPAAATLPSSQQFPQLPPTVQDSWSPILFSGVKQIQNKLVRSFSYFTSSQKTEVCERFDLKRTTVCFLLLFTGSVNFRAGKKPIYHQIIPLQKSKYLLPISQEFKTKWPINT